ncbi:MAG: hypothetical protein ACKV2Q_36650 [Planctomycetaceae bacterium]
MSNPNRPVIHAAPEVRRLINAAMLDIADGHGTWLSHVVGDRRTKAVVATREAMLLWLRSGIIVAERDDDGGWTLYIDDGSGGRVPPYVVIADLIGTDHSTLTYMRKRKTLRPPPKPYKKDPTEAEIEERKAGMRQ